MTRIAVGGFLHETNTFAPTKATYRRLSVHGGGWPAMAQGPDVLKSDAASINVGLAGFVDSGRSQRLGDWFRPSPAPPARRPMSPEDAFERIVKVMVDGIKASSRPARRGLSRPAWRDGHRASRRRRRRNPGAGAPRDRQGCCRWWSSLDLHANVTPEMVDHADALIAYRTYPHVDMADTGRTSAKHLALLLNTKQRFAKVFPAIAVPDSRSAGNAPTTSADQRHLRDSSLRWRAMRCRRCPSRRAFRPPTSTIAGRACSPMARRKATPIARRMRSSS